MDQQGERGPPDAGAAGGDTGAAGTDALLRRIAAAPEIAPPPLLAPGTIVDDTFVIEEKLGAGGMGVVYRARDRRLGREVALKLHLRASDPRAFDRLLREAQSLARLSHPNVVTVHEVGTYQGQLFIAMELVEGGSLRRWLREAPRSAGEVIAAFVQAGRGLEAAHGAGLIHRDVKPDNIFLAKDGRALVGDFGLARTAGPTHEDTDDGSDPGAGAVRAPIGTETGTVLGTLAYMAPEQLADGSVDARSDQFSFCASLWEVLAGELPFSGGSTRTELLAAMENAPEPPPLSDAVPRRVREALRRGLSVDPDRRHPSMAALLAELEPRERRTRAWWGTAAVAAAALATIAYLGLGRGPAAETCEADPTLAGLWTAERREAIERSFGAASPGDTGNGAAAIALAAEYAAAIAADRDRACRETRVRGAAPEGIYGRRLGCLHRLERGFEGLLAAWEQADRVVVERSAAAAAALPPVAMCADEAYLLAAVKPPSDPSTAVEVESVRASLGHAQALYESARFDEAGARFADALEDARRLDYAPLLAEALLSRGRMQYRRDQYDAAAQSFEEAFFTARRSGHDALAGEAAALLALLTGVDRVDAERSALWASLAQVEVERDTGTAALELQVQRILGLLADFDGRLDEAVDRLRRALDLARALYDETHPRVAEVLRELGAALHGLGQYDLAAESYGRSLAIFEDRFGPDHPQVGGVLRSLGLLDAERGEAELGRARLERALAIAEATLGPEAQETGYVLLNLGVAYYHAGDLEGAIGAYRRALANVESHVGQTHPDVGLVLNSLAMVHEAQGEGSAALEYHRRALDVARAHEPRHPQVAIVLGNIGGVYLSMGEPRQAIESLRESIDLWKEFPEHAQQAVYWTLLAEAQTQLGRGAEAVTAAEAGLARLDDGASGYRRARAEMALAMALWEAGGDRDRALELGRQGVARYRSLSDPQPVRTAAAEAWLAAREQSP